MKHTLALILLLASSYATANETDPAESASINIIKLIERGDLVTAERMTDQLIKKFPNYQSGHLLKAEIQAIQLGLPPTELNSLKNDQSHTLGHLRSEVKQRWRHALYPPPQGGAPKQIVKLSPKHQHVIVADAKRSRLYIFQNDLGTPKLVEDHYMGIGKAGYKKQREGDNLTPLGVYHITQYIDGRELPDLYGAGAYPINYPNAWDKIKKRTGHGIWIHGVPSNNYSRPPLSSEGCMTLNNDAFDGLAQFVDVTNTPIIITDGIEWMDYAEWNNRQRELRVALTRWELDWESLDTARYLNNYDTDFFNGEKNYSTWATHKTRVNKSKSFIKVELSEISMYDMPGEKDSVLVSFKQKYSSDNVTSTSNKAQIWKRLGPNQWRIIYEGDPL